MLVQVIIHQYVVTNLSVALKHVLHSCIYGFEKCLSLQHLHIETLFAKSWSHHGLEKILEGLRFRPQGLIYIPDVLSKVTKLLTNYF